MQIFVNPLQIIHQLILSYKKFKYLTWYNQQNFFADFLVHDLIKNVINPLAKSVLISLGLTAAGWAADAEIHKKS